jgi:hypothetical protein
VKAVYRAHIAWESTGAGPYFPGSKAAEGSAVQFISPYRYLKHLSLSLAQSVSHAASVRRKAWRSSCQVSDIGHKLNESTKLGKISCKRLSESSGIWNHKKKQTCRNAVLLLLLLLFISHQIVGL